MPRRNRRDPGLVDARGVARPRSAAPSWAALPGHDVRQVSGEKEYRCPGCDHLVRAGTLHLVVVPNETPDERRHWHLECWRRELRRIGRYRPPA